MQATLGSATLHVARTRARRWLRVFQQMVRVLDRLEPQESALARSLVFLIQRALGDLDGGDTVVPVRPLAVPVGPDAADGGELPGDELRAAVDLVRGGELRRDARVDPAGDEFEVLLVLAGALTESADGGSYGDPAITVDALLREYRALKSLAAPDVMRIELFPLAFRRRWAALQAAAATREDPLRRLAFELSVMKVIHALFALAIGWRRAPEFERGESAGDAWFAWSLGEAILKGARR
ncbi:MAG: hypothetical protein FJ293_11935 [Planctomycetes bacterium]|nr:hypothetical protein [Planctomycetota bacterium]